MTAISAWNPKTEIGKLVKEKKITSLIEIMEMGKPVLEPEIIDVLVPNLQQETIELSSTQRMTDSGRKAKYRAVVVVGDGNEFIGLGQGKADEVRPAVELATKNAKLNLVHSILGCGSAECGCGTKHSVPIKITGRYGGVTVTLKPAPRGTGIVANRTIRKVLQLAGIKDVWTRATGRTKNRFNSAAATVEAIDMLNRIRLRREWT
ncbi:MAG: 30S ribosomal protein S5 [Candidatus Micrarchaeia archaeon]